MGPPPRRWLLVGIVVLLVGVVVALLSTRLAALLAIGVLLGLLAGVIAGLPPPWPRRIGVAALVGVLLVRGVFYLTRPEPGVPIRTNGPFVTAYRQETRLNGTSAEVEERYVIQADPQVVIERVRVGGTGSLTTNAGGQVDGMTITPDGSTAEFTVVRPALPIEQQAVGFRSWETRLPLLSAVVEFRRPEDTETQRWPVVRCRDLSLLLRVSVADGQLIVATPPPEVLSGASAEWRSLDAFDPTDPAPTVTLQVDQSPAPLRTLRSGGHFAVATLWDQLAAVVAGSAAGWIVAVARKRWLRIRGSTRSAQPGEPA